LQNWSKIGAKLVQNWYKIMPKLGLAKIFQKDNKSAGQAECST